MLDRTAEGDFKYMKAKDIAVRVTEEWKGLTSTEKEVCSDLSFSWQPCTIDQ
jgi:hypothetical protein